MEKEKEKNKVPYVRILKKDVVRYDDNGLTVMHKGKEWTVQYGEYVNKEDIDNLDEDGVIYIKKFGRKGWIVANAITENKELEKAEELKKELEKCKDKLRRIEEILKE